MANKKVQTASAKIPRELRAYILYDAPSKGKNTSYVPSKVAKGHQSPLLRRQGSQVPSPDWYKEVTLSSER